MFAAGTRIFRIWRAGTDVTPNRNCGRGVTEEEALTVVTLNGAQCYTDTG